jgi:hypothetical protein
MTTDGAPHQVCLNFQTWDLPMRLNFAKFLANGSCGFVLKPPGMRRAALEKAAAASGGGAALGAASGAASSAASALTAGMGHLAATATYGDGVHSCSFTPTTYGDGDDLFVPGEEPFDFVTPMAMASYSLWRVRIVSARHLPKV